jgi:hypothetical protein
MAGNWKLPKFEELPEDVRERWLSLARWQKSGKVEVPEHIRAAFESLSSLGRWEGKQQLAAFLEGRQRFLAQCQERQQHEQHRPPLKLRKPKANSKEARAINRLSAIYPNGVKCVKLKHARKAFNADLGEEQRFSDRTFRRAFDWLRANS